MSLNVEVAIVNAFVDGEAGGNPAGIVLAAERFSAEQKQGIAAAVGLSETAFVSPSKIADVKLEFFTPVRQIPHCGHATIATFAYLRQLGNIRAARSSKETIDGTREIVLEDDKAFMEQTEPRYADLSPEDRGALPAILGLDEGDLFPDIPAQAVNTGVGFLVVPVRDAATVKRAKPDQKAVEALSERLDLVGLYLFSRETRIEGRDAGARMFAPRFGIPEESATGMAAGPLACFLHDRMKANKDQLVIEQGHLMEPPSPSAITVRLFRKDGRIRKLMAGGRARRMETRTVEI
ncbi:MAG: PhzF family phenazine biosynthesis protein [Thermodesulfobacteriota bacterium]